jgi:predicted nucleic acid-binding protein
VDFLVAAEAARIRAEASLTMPDAVVIATGVLTSSQVLVTNDRRLAAVVPQVVPGMSVCLLSDLA